MTARYRAPAGGRRALADPPLADIGSAARSQRRTASTRSAVRIAGVPLAEFRRQAVDRSPRGGPPVPRPKGGEPVAACGYATARRRTSAGFLSPRRLGQELRPARPRRTPRGRAAEPCRRQRHGEVGRDPRPGRGRRPGQGRRGQLVPFDRPKGTGPTRNTTSPTGPVRLVSRTPRRRTRGPGASSRWSDQIWPMIGAELDRGATLGDGRVARPAVAANGAWGVTQLRTAGQPAGRDAGVRRVRRARSSPTCRGSSTSTTRAIRDYRAAQPAAEPEPPGPGTGRRGDRIEAPFWVWRIGWPDGERLFVRLAAEGASSCRPATGPSASCRAAAPDGFDRAGRELAPPAGRFGRGR